MNKTSLTNSLLAIIAFCLVALTFAQLGLIPKANAGTNPKFAPTEVVIVGIEYDSTNDDFRALQRKAIPVRVIQ